MAIGYWIFAGVTLTIVLQAFLKDSQASKRDAKAWLFVLIASLLWPITLPFIIRRKLRNLIQPPQLSQGDMPTIDDSSALTSDS